METLNFELRAHTKIATEYLSHNLDTIKSTLTIDNNMLADSTKIQYAVAIDLLNEMLTNHINSLRACMEDKIDFNIYNVQRIKKLDLISLIANL